MEPPEERLRLHPGQRDLTPAQAAEVERFTTERLQAQLSTDPVDEPGAEALLARAYAAASLAAPRHIHWLDGPLELVAVLAHADETIYVEEQYRDRVPHCVWDDVKVDHEQMELLHHNRTGTVDDRVRRLRDRADKRVAAAFNGVGAKGMGHVPSEVWRRVRDIAREPLLELTGDRIWRAVATAVARRSEVSRSTVRSVLRQECSWTSA